jgi:hypothetical protein
VEDHARRAVSAAEREGRLITMDSTNDQPRLAEHASDTRSEEEARTPAVIAATVARMLANPRRIRRN